MLENLILNDEIGAVIGFDYEIYFIFFFVNE